MGRPKIIVAPNDYEKWGKLVKTWATGKNYVDYSATEDNPVPTKEEKNDPKYPKPRSFAEFVDQCGKATISIIFDDGANTPVKRDEGMGLIVIQGDADVHVIRLPPVEKLLESEQRFLDGATYELPKFYSRVFGGAILEPNAQATKVDKMKLHAERVGEYTLNTCA
jgi:hypothetical protein